MLLTLLISGVCLAQVNSSLITYGLDAPIKEGDDDYRQIVYFRIPDSVNDTLFFRLFDADCGGENDSYYGGEWDTRMSYRLYGGVNAFSLPKVKSPAEIYRTADEGSLIAEKTVGQDDFLDNRWFNLCAFSPTAGELIGNNYYFKIVIDGIAGNDGNVYDLFISNHPKRNIAPKKLFTFNYVPTIRLPGTGIFAEMRLFVPQETRSLHVHNFDISGGEMGVETAFRSNLPVASSGQGVWEETIVPLEDTETGRQCAVTFKGGYEIPNDGTFFVLDDKGNNLPIQLPIYIRQLNSRPVPAVRYLTMSDPLTVVFDGMGTVDADGDAMDYYWDFGDGKNGSGERVSHKYSAPGEYNASLIVTDNSGQVGNSTIKRFLVIINMPPIATAGDDIIGSPRQKLTFDASRSTDPDGSISRYKWDLGDGKRKEGMTITHSYRRAGHYTVTLRVEDDSGTPQNFATDELDVWINSPPVVDAGPDIACSMSQTIILDARKSYDADGDIVDFLWDMGDGTQKSGLEISHNYPQAGSYIVELTVADNAESQNSNNSDKMTVVVNDPPIPVIDIDDSRVSPAEKIRFSAKNSLDNDGKIIQYDWDFGDGSTDSGATVKHPYENPGVYNVTLTVRDNSGTNSEYRNTSAEIIINYQPVARAGEDQLVTSSEVKFEGSLSDDQDGYITEFLWNFGDGSKNDEAAPLHIYTNPGTYIVKLTVTDDSETSTSRHSDELTVVVNSLPIADAGPDYITTPGQEILFDASESFDMDGNINLYLWDFGDKQNMTGESVSHVYDRPGIYTVTLTVFDNTNHNNAYNTDDTQVFVNDPPIADAGFDILTAPGEKVRFDGTQSYDSDGTIEKYTWEFSDGAKPLKGSKVTRSFADPGIYSATLTVKDNSGAINNTHSDKTVIQVNHSPVAHAGQDLLTNSFKVEFDASASTDADGDRLTYLWDFGDGSKPKPGVKVEYIYQKHGNYPVILRVDDGKGFPNSVHSTMITVKIDAPPIADAGKDTTVCAGDVILFDGSRSSDPEMGVMRYNWDFGDGTAAEGVNPAKTFVKGGVYQVTLKITDDSGLPENVDIDQIIVKVAESPVAEAGEDNIVGVNQEVHFDGTQSTDVDGLVNSYFWDFGDGGTGGGPTPTHVFTAPGMYRVTLTITGDRIGNCSNRDSDELTVTVDDAPLAKFTVISSAPVGAPVVFDASESMSRMSEIVSYEWDFMDGTTGSGKVTEHVFSRHGKFIVTLKVTTDSKTRYNSNSTQQLVMINAPPVAEAGEDKITGIGQAVIFKGAKSSDPDGAIIRYSWDFDDGSSGEGISIRHAYANSGKYKVTLLVEDDANLDNSRAVDSLFVIVNDRPVPVIEGPVWVCPGENISFGGAASFDNDSDIKSYKWSVSDGTTLQGTEINHTFKAPGKYQVTLTVNDGIAVSNSENDTTTTVNVNFTPTASARAAAIASPGETVDFDGSFSNDRDGAIIRYDWNFGDGSIAEGVKTTHAYSDPGRYAVSLTITDDSGTKCAVNSDEFTIRINSPPVASAGSDQEVFFGGAVDVVTFDASGSTDPDGDALTYSWDFGDKSSGRGLKVSHRYLKAGVYKVKLTVNDNTGTSSAISVDEAIVTVKKRN